MIVPVILADWVALEEGQDVDPESVRAPPDSVPVRLWVRALIVFLIEPVNAVPVCDRTI